MKERIVELRNYYKMTLKDFSARIGISLGNLSGIEKGYTPVQERHVRLILSAFPEVSEDWLRNGVLPMIKVPEDDVSRLVAQYGFPEICAKLLRTFDSLPVHGQEVVLQFAQSFIADMIRDSAPAQMSDAEKNARSYIASRVEEDRMQPEAGADLA